MERFLDGFADTIKHDTEKVDMNSSMVVIDLFNENTPLCDFVDKLDGTLRNEMSGVFLCDFQADQVKLITDTVNMYNGMYKIKLNAVTDLEDNEIYCAFATPVQAYAFLVEIMSKRHKPE
jgi:hypothetical protein